MARKYLSAVENLDSWPDFDTDRFVPLDHKDDDDDVNVAVHYWIDYLKTRGIPKSYAVKYAQLRVDVDSLDLIIPYFDFAGDLADFYRRRLWRTRGSQKFSQPAGSGNKIYMPPVVANKQSPSMRALFEGETRAMGAAAIGIQAIAMGGIDSHHVSSRPDQLITELAAMKWGDVHSLIGFDYDVSVRRDLQDKVLRLAELLEAEGASPVCFYYPPEMVGSDPKTGPDDWLGVVGAAQYRKELKEAKPYTSNQFNSWGTNRLNLDLTLTTVNSDWNVLKPPPITYTWDGWLPEGTVALLVAPGGTGKSFKLQQLSHAVATGSALFGSATKKGIAVYLSLEDGEADLQRRYKAIVENDTEFLSETERKRYLRDLSKNLVVKSFRGQELHLLYMDGYNIAQSRVIKPLIQQLRDLGNVVLVSFDPLSRAHSCPDENQAWGTAMINVGDRIATELNCTVIFSHHTGKNKDKSADRPEYSRGASSLHDGSRIQINLATMTRDDQRLYHAISDDDIEFRRVLQVHHSKQNHVQKHAPLFLRRLPNGVLIPFDAVRVEDPTLKTHLDAIYDFAKKTGHEPFSQNDVVKKYRKQIFLDMNVSEGKARKIIEAGIEQGSLVLTEQKVGGYQKLRFADNYSKGEQKWRT